MKERGKKEGGGEVRWGTERSTFGWDVVAGGCEGGGGVLREGGEDEGGGEGEGEDGVGG